MNNLHIEQSVLCGTPSVYNCEATMFSLYPLQVLYALTHTLKMCDFFEDAVGPKLKFLITKLMLLRMWCLLIKHFVTCQKYIPKIDHRNYSKSSTFFSARFSRPEETKKLRNVTSAK